jgi:hypothetical protein
MVHDTKETGSMTYSMAKERNPGLMDQSTRENTWQARNTVGECTDGTMEADTKANGLKTKSEASVCTPG